MLIDYDHNPSLSVDQKLQSLIENMQLAFNEKADKEAAGKTNGDVPKNQDSQDAVPIGSITPFAGSTAPTNWLLCDGSAVSRTTYSALFAVIGTTYGAGDDTATFNLPDLRGRTAIGAGIGTASDATERALGALGGSERITLTTEQMPSHNHNGATYYDNLKISNGAYGGSGSGQALNTANGGDHNIRTASAGGGQSHGNMQPYLALNHIIYAGA